MASKTQAGNMAGCRVCRDHQSFDCATWLHKARAMPKEEFQREVERELTGKDSEPHEMIYFKLYKSQIPVVEQAIETAALMLGSDKSRGYCLEMICADFLAGASLDSGQPDLLLHTISRLFGFLSVEQKQVCRTRNPKHPMNQDVLKRSPVRLEEREYQELRERVLRRDGWRRSVDR